jgi:hypothetical protein
MRPAAGRCRTRSHLSCTHAARRLTASSAAATAGRLAMNQADAAARRRRWDTEVAAFRSAAQVRLRRCQSAVLTAQDR